MAQPGKASASLPADLSGGGENGPKFSPWDLCGGRGELTPTGCLLISTCVLCHSHPTPTLTNESCKL